MSDLLRLSSLMLHQDQDLMHLPVHPRNMSLQFYTNAYALKKSIIQFVHFRY